jgi:Ca2+-binding EF-hand superfamily protein
MLQRQMAFVMGLALVLPAMAGSQEPRNRVGDKKPATQTQSGPLHFDIDAFIKEYDRNGNGMLERNEVPRWLRDRFSELDTNHDGKLSKDELEKGIVHLQPRQRPSDVVFVLIEMSDCDDECVGEIQQMYDVLRQLDTNHNGKIDPEELKATRQRLLEERVDRRIEELDANRDGKISKDEARGRIKENFDTIDTNHDGFISRDELLRAATEHIHGSGKAQPPKDGSERKP